LKIQSLPRHITLNALANRSDPLVAYLFGFFVVVVSFLLKITLQYMVALFLFFFSTEMLGKCKTFVSNSGSGCSYTYASKAFLFSLYNNDGYNPVKLTQYQNQQHAMYHCSYGPTFGYSFDIYISDNALSKSNSYTYCGHTYSVPSGYSTGDCGFFTGGRYFTPTDIEVFYEIGD